MNFTHENIGQWFKVPWSPNPHVLVKIELRYDSHHGEYCWHEAGLVKRRNSEVRPWGSAVNMVRADQNDVEPWDGPLPALTKEPDE